MSPSDRFYHLISLCYEATSAEGGWRRFAAELARAISATDCAAIVVGEPGTAHTVLWSHGRPAQSDDWLPDCIDAQALSALGNRSHAKATPMGRFLAGSLSRHNGQPCAVVAIRSSGAPEFSLDDFELLDELLPHIDQALRVYRTIRSSEVQHGAFTEIMDRLPEAIFLVDRLCNVVSCNLTGRVIAQQNDGLSLIDGRISLAQQNEQGALRRLVAEAARRPVSPIRSPTLDADDMTTMSVTRPSGKTALPVVVTPVLCRGVADGRPEIVAAVITKDADQRGSVLVPDLAIAFGLTPGEKRLAGMVAGGLGLKEASETLSITKNTVRTHMKRIYAKTGARSQADLVRLLSRGSIELRQLETDG